MEPLAMSADGAATQFELRDAFEASDEALARQLQLEENSQDVCENSSSAPSDDARTLTPYMQMDLESQSHSDMRSMNSILQRARSCGCWLWGGLRFLLLCFLGTRVGKAIARRWHLHEHMGWKRRSKCVGCWLAVTYLLLIPVFYFAGHFMVYAGSYRTMMGEIKYPVAPKDNCAEFNFTAEHSGRSLLGYRCTYFSRNDFWVGAKLENNATRSAIFFGGNNMCAWNAVNLGVELLPGAADNSTVEILSFSYPGYAPNSGWTREEDILDDAFGLVRYASQRTAVPPVILGWSLGTAVATAVASRLQESEMSCMVLGNPFTSMWSMVRVVTAFTGSPWVWLFDRWPTLRRAETVHAPTLVLSGLKDELIPAAQHKDVFEQIPGRRKKLVELPTKHNQAYAFVDEKYDDIKEFFTKWCPSFAEESIDHI